MERDIAPGQQAADRVLLVGAGDAHLIRSEARDRVAVRVVDPADHLEVDGIGLAAADQVDRLLPALVGREVAEDRHGQPIGVALAPGDRPHLGGRGARRHHRNRDDPLGRNGGIVAPEVSRRLRCARDERVDRVGHQGHHAVAARLRPGRIVVARDQAGVALVRAAIDDVAESAGVIEQQPALADEEVIVQVIDGGYAAGPRDEGQGQRDVHQMMDVDEIDLMLEQQSLEEPLHERVR